MSDDQHAEVTEFGESEPPRKVDLNSLPFEERTALLFVMGWTIGHIAEMERDSEATVETAVRDMLCALNDQVAWMRKDIETCAQEFYQEHWALASNDCPRMPDDLSLAREREAIKIYGECAQRVQDVLNVRPRRMSRFVKRGE